MEFSFDMKVVVPADVLFQETLGESVLLSIRDGSYFGLDNIGTRMWTVLTTAPSLRTGCDVLKEEYDVDAKLLEQDVRELIEKLAKNGLIEIQPGSLATEPKDARDG